jgi:SAM-dependent methyltransferase
MEGNLTSMRIFCEHNVPANQNLVYATEAEALAAPTGTLDIVCDEQGFVFNQAFDGNLVRYSDAYDNNQHCSPLFAKYIDQQIEWLLPQIPQGATVVEVGCGKGFYISQIAQARQDCECLGFDTSYAGDEPALHNLKIHRKYYDAASAVSPDVVVSRHVIEHIPKPVDFLKSIRATMPEGALLFLETPDLEWILRNTVIYDFFYEHCNYWTQNSLANALAQSGFEVEASQTNFGGQYLWMTARAAKADEQIPLKPDTGILNRLQDFARKRSQIISAYSKRLQEMQESPVLLWGAGAKGVTFAHLLDQGRQLISALVDINPKKQHRYIGGTALYIVPPSEIATRYGGGGEIILLNSNYKAEVEGYLAEQDLQEWKVRIFN